MLSSSHSSSMRFVTGAMRRRWPLGNGAFRYLQTGSNGGVTQKASVATSLPKDATPEQVDAYLRQANAHMQKYDEAKELLRQGKLPSKNAHLGPPNNQGYIQAGVVVTFLVLFAAMPFLGKKIARDDEFRKKWVPNWYDFTVAKPDKPWTRDELHEQMLAVEKDVRERAIAGDFTPEKLQELQMSLQGIDHYPHKQLQIRRAGQDASTAIPSGWDKIHPGVADGDKYNEDD